MTAEMDQSLRRQSYSLLSLQRELFEDLCAQVKDLLSTQEWREIDQVFFTGCGDSYAAAMAVKTGWMELTHIRGEAVTAMEFSRSYPAEFLTPRTLVVVISISGNGARIEESVKKAKSGGAKVLAVTKNRDSDIGRRADWIVELKISPFERGPGNRNYFASVLALLLLGIRGGERLGNYTDQTGAAYRQSVRLQGEELDRLLPEMDRILYDVSLRWKDFACFDFVGEGMEYASAWFGHAKIIEAVGAFTTHINSEEWFHMNNFFRDIAHCGTVFVASKASPGFSRTREAVAYAARLGRPLVVITDGQESDFGTNAVYIQVPSSTFRPAMALTQYVPVCLLAGYLGALAGERNCRGCLGPWEFAAGGTYIRESEKMNYEGTSVTHDEAVI